MYSVVIPTMWKGVELASMFPHLDACEHIDEIIVIDNLPGKEPEWFKRTWQKKIKLITYGKNIYVNPAWNIGIDQAVNDNICLMSDDVTFDIRIFENLLGKLQDGPVGPRKVFLNHTTQKIILPTDDYSLEVPQTKQPYGWGSCIFLYKPDFIPIPKQLMIYYGDEWIFMSHRAQGKHPRTVNLNVLTHDSTTSYHFGASGDYDMDGIHAANIGAMLKDVKSIPKTINIKELIDQVDLRNLIFGRRALN